MSSADLQRLSESRSPNCKYAEIVKKDTIAETDWLKLQTVTYRLGGKKDRYDREWNMASRTTTREDSDYADSVVILAMCSEDNNHNEETEILLVRQFRPPHGTKF